MQEVEVLRICDEAFRHSKLSHRYELKVSSSELLDALLEECNVDLHDRVPLLQLLQERNESLGTETSGNSLKKF